MTLRETVFKIIDYAEPGIEHIISNTYPSRLRSCLENMGYDVEWVGGELNMIEWECTHSKLPKLFVEIWVEDFKLILGVSK